MSNVSFSLEFGGRLGLERLGGFALGLFLHRSAVFFSRVWGRVVVYGGASLAGGESRGDSLDLAFLQSGGGGNWGVGEFSGATGEERFAASSVGEFGAGGLVGGTLADFGRAFFSSAGSGSAGGGGAAALEGERAGGEEVVLTRLAPDWRATRFVGWGDRNWRGDLFGSGIASVRCWKSA